MKTGQVTPRSVLYSISGSCAVDAVDVAGNSGCTRPGGDNKGLGLAVRYILTTFFHNGDRCAKPTFLNRYCVVFRCRYCFTVDSVSGAGIKACQGFFLIVDLDIGRVVSFAQFQAMLHQNIRSLFVFERFLTHMVTKWNLMIQVKVQTEHSMQ